MMMCGGDAFEWVYMPYNHSDEWRGPCSFCGKYEANGGKCAPRLVGDANEYHLEQMLIRAREEGL